MLTTNYGCYVPISQHTPIIVHVHNHNRFVEEIMPSYFRQTRFPSFQRQLSLYGFLRLYQKTKDNDAVSL